MDIFYFISFVVVNALLTTCIGFAFYKLLSAKIAKTLAQNKEDTIASLQDENKVIERDINILKESYKLGLDSLSNNIMSLTKINEMKLEGIRTSVDKNLQNIQNDNNYKLEKIRNTVEEKLHETLETRLNDSFKIVSERLEQVYKGLGEMRNLASGVGDLKKVLSNVSTRGIWGEVQLGAIIEQILTPNQYAKEVRVNPESRDVVEFAIKLPAKDGSKDNIWLPMDAKFPLSDFQKLVEYQDNGDIENVKNHTILLERSIKKAAKDISEKYICPPHTTDFAIMFLPIEALYAQVLRISGLMEHLQEKYRVIITSPTTLSAILSSLQMGFKTLAIERRSSEVWKVLGSVKSEFIKFADILGKTKTKLDQASSVIVDAERRTRAIQRRLESVEKIEDNPIAEKTKKVVIPIAENN